MTDPGRFNPDGLILSENYSDTMENIVQPYLRERGKEITVSGDGGKPIACVRYDADAPRGTAILIHGFTESAYKFSEIIYSLLQNGFSVCAYDHRGHGRSWRDPDIQDPSLTHVDDFNEYVRDLEAVMKQAVDPMPKPRVLFAHSMGGAVASLYMERNPGTVENAALCAPMIAPYLGGLPVFAVRAICSVSAGMGKSKQRVFFSRPYDGPEDFAAACSNGRQRFDWYSAFKDAHPAYQNNGPTYRWLDQAIRVTGMILEKGQAEKITARVRVYTAETDTSVLPKPQEAFAKRLPSGQRFLVHGAKHEIYMSVDAVLFPWWNQVLEFLKN